MANQVEHLGGHLLGRHFLIKLCTTLSYSQDLEIVVYDNNLPFIIVFTFLLHIFGFLFLLAKFENYLIHWTALPLREA